MGRDRDVGPGLSIILLASITIGAVYWTGTIVGSNNTYYETFTNAMQQAIDSAYGFGVKEKDSVHK